MLTDQEERASVAVASNAPFSKRGQTFADAGPGDVEADADAGSQ